MASSSSASKVAKLAQKGKGKKVRFQGGTLFPVVIVVTVLVLTALVVYARQSRPSAGEGAPTSLDHWHAAIGFYVCDDNGLKVEPNLTGALEETDATGQLVNQGFVSTGIHSHSDGVMHWHPNSSGKATGTNAKLKVFLDNYDVTLSNSELKFPAGQGGEDFKEGSSKCVIDGKEETASLKLWVWDNFCQANPADAANYQEPQVYTTNMGDVRIRNNGMVFMVAFVPDDVDPKAPETAVNLPELGAADGSSVDAQNCDGTPVDATAVTTADSGDTTPGTTGDSTADTATGSSTVDTATGSSTADTTDASDPATTTTVKSTTTTVKSTSTTG